MPINKMPILKSLYTNSSLINEPILEIIFTSFRS